MIPYGKALTVGGPIDPEALGAVLMHEHLCALIYDWDNERFLTDEAPVSAKERGILEREAFPNLKKCVEHGCHAYVDATFAPHRTQPEFYVEASEITGMHIILCTGFYREVETDTYWVKRAEDAIWPFVREASVEELSEFCVREIVEGIHGTDVRAGAIKLASSRPEMTEAEKKAFRAGARAQKETGVHITTHCTQMGVETNQLKLLEDEGVDLNRVVIGHTWNLSIAEYRKTCIDWMRRGANFMPTNMGIGDDGGEKWRPLIEGIRDIFDKGLGDKIVFGLDTAFSSSEGHLRFKNTPPPPFLHMFTHTLPAFRKMGLTAEAEETIMVKNPARIVPVVKP